ncbi:hypothetical protein HanIR_Chr00c11g0907891 [Helianthus annuus]|nr:hypothetical protein HanIR_Chr00c11g0907891 [Helianthus annuus]
MLYPKKTHRFGLFHHFRDIWIFVSKDYLIPHLPNTPNSDLENSAKNFLFLFGTQHRNMCIQEIVETESNDRRNFAPLCNYYPNNLSKLAGRKYMITSFDVFTTEWTIWIPHFDVSGCQSCSSRKPLHNRPPRDYPNLFWNKIIPKEWISRNRSAVDCCNVLYACYRKLTCRI